jgi:hypothetical protein
MMIAGVSTVERAYQLAESGLYLSLSEIKKRLRDEGFVDAAEQIGGSQTLALSLRRLIDAGSKES